MSRRTERALTVGRAVFHEVRAERLTFMAGSIAYNAFVSLLPLLLLVLAVLATVGDESLQAAFLDLTGAVLTAGASEVLVAELRGSGAGVSLFGAAVLVWGTLRIFRGLDTAFSDIYESESENTFTDQLRDGILVLVAFGVAVVAALVIESSVSLDGGGVGLWLVRRLVLVAALAVALFPIYYVFPDADDIAVREVLPGVLVAAVGLTAFESLFQVYVAYKTAGGTGGGLLAGVLVLLTWLYFSGLVVLLGAAVNAVLSNRSRDVDIAPVLGGLPRQDRDAPDREAVTAAVDRLSALLDSGRRVEVAVDDESVALPPPDNVVTQAGGSTFRPGGGVSIELRWSPRESPAGDRAEDVAAERPDEAADD